MPQSAQHRLHFASSGATHDLGEVHGRDLLVVDVIKVDVPEERVLLDVLGISLACSQSSDRVSIQQLESQTGKSALVEERDHSQEIAHPLQQVDGLTGHGHRVERLVLQDGIKDLILVVSPEGRLAEQHLVGQNTKRPPVDSASVSLFEQNLCGIICQCGVQARQRGATYLGSHEFGGSAKSAGSLAEPHVFLAQTIIGNLDVAVQGEKNVIQLQITVKPGSK